jgi:hypothetical protein
MKADPQAGYGIKETKRGYVGLRLRGPSDPITFVQTSLGLGFVLSGSLNLSASFTSIVSRAGHCGGSDWSVLTARAS